MPNKNSEKKKGIMLSLGVELDNPKEFEGKSVIEELAKLTDENLTDNLGRYYLIEIINDNGRREIRLYTSKELKEFIEDYEIQNREQIHYATLHISYSGYRTKQGVCLHEVWTPKTRAKKANLTAELRKNVLKSREERQQRHLKTIKLRQREKLETGY